MTTEMRALGAEEIGLVAGAGGSINVSPVITVNPVTLQIGLQVQPVTGVAVAVLGGKANVAVFAAQYLNQYLKA